MEWILDVPIRLLRLQITCGAKPCIMYITSTYGVYDVDSIPTPAVAAFYLREAVRNYLADFSC